MVRVEVLAVGRELLIGRTLNTNAHWVGRRLALMGTMINEMATVDDDLREISLAVKSSVARRPDFLVVMGGLGPTPDDMTLEGVAMGLRRRLALNEEAVSMIRATYVRRGMSGAEMTPARKKMAVLPVGSTPMLNPVGTAPGVRMEIGRTRLFCLPGVPSEMRGIFRRSVEPEIRSRVGELGRKAITIWFEGIFESNIAPLILRGLRRNPGTYIKSHPKGLRHGVSKIEVDIVSVRKDPVEAEEVAVRVARTLIADVERAGGRVKSLRGLD